MAARAGQVAVGCPPTPHRPPQVQPLHPTEGDPQRGARVPTPGSPGTSAGKGRHWGRPPCHSPGSLPRPGAGDIPRVTPPGAGRVPAPGTPVPGTEETETRPEWALSPGRSNAVAGTQWLQGHKRVFSQSRTAAVRERVPARPRVPRSPPGLYEGRSLASGGSGHPGTRGLAVPHSGLRCHCHEALPL